VNKEILRLAIPNIISNISVPLLSTVDVIFMGGLSGIHLGAVGLGAMIFSFLFWNFGFLRMGTTGMTAQFYGKGDQEQIGLTLQRALMLAVIIGLILLLISPLLLRTAIILMNVSDLHLDMVSTYFSISILAAPATLMMFALNGWFFGVQNAMVPLILTIIVNIINIGLSYWLVIIQGWGIAGVASGTVIAQYIGLLGGLGYIALKHNNFLKKQPFSRVLKKEVLGRFFKVNLDIFIRTICLSIAFGFFYSRSSAYGELILAANVILMQLLNWMSYGIDGFGYAAESLVGKYYGAANSEKLSKAIQLSLVWGLSMAILYSAAYGLFSSEIIGIFTEDIEVIPVALHFISWMVILPLLGFGSYIWDGIFIGITASSAMRNTMMAALGVFLMTYYISKFWMDSNHGLWLSLALFLFTRGMLQWWWFSTHKTKLAHV